MKSLELLKKIRVIARQNNWELQERKSIGTHRILYLYRDGECLTACLSEHRSKDVSSGVIKDVVKSLKLKGQIKVSTRWK